MNDSAERRQYYYRTLNCGGRNGAIEGLHDGGLDGDRPAPGGVMYLMQLHMLVTIAHELSTIQ